MITAQFPAEYSFIQNNNTVVFTSDQYILSAGEKARFALKFTGLPEQDESFTLRWDDDTYQLPFVFTNTPANKGNLIPLPSGGQLLTDYVETVVWAELLSNIFLTEYYDITYDDDSTIIFTARNPGKRNTMFIAISYPQDFATSDPAYFRYGADVMYNYQLRIQIELLYKNHVEEDYHVLRFLANPSKGVAQLRLNEVLSLQDGNNTLPTFGLNTGEVTGTVYYGFRYAERFGDNSLDFSKLQQTMGFKFFPGGVSVRDYADLDLQAQLVANKTWLINSLISNKVGIDQSFPLSYYNYAGGADPVVKVTFRYSDDSDETINAYTLQNASNDAVFYFNIGPSYLLDFSDDEKTVVGYSVWVEKTGENAVSEILDFEVDRNLYRNLVDILFRNSTGYYQPLRLTGDQVIDSEVKRSKVNQYLPNNYNRSQRVGKNYDTSLQRSRVITTQYLSKASVGALTDLLMSESVYLIEKDHYRPVTIEVEDSTESTSISGRRNSRKIRILDNAQEKSYSNGRYKG